MADGQKEKRAKLFFAEQGWSRTKEGKDGSKCGVFETGRVRL